MVDLKQASIDEDIDEEPRTLEWKGLLRRAFSSKKRRRKRDSSSSPRASLTPSDQRAGSYTGMNLLKPPTPKYGKRPLGASRSNPLEGCGNNAYW